MPNSKTSTYIHIFFAFAIFLSVLPSKASGSEKPQIEWLGDGLILISQRSPEQKWLFDPAEKTFDLLPYSTKYADISISRSGKKIVVYDEVDSFRFGPVAGPLSKPLPIPKWVVIQAPPGSEDSCKYEMIYKETRFFWISDSKLFVNQRNKDTGEVKCKMFDTSQNKWSPFTDNCISNNDLSIVKLSPGPNGLMAVYSSNEGVPVLHIDRWSLEARHEKTKFPNFNLYSGVLNASFRTDGPNIYLTTPCILERTFQERGKLPCSDVCLDSAGWRMYSWLPNEDKPPVLLKSELPPFVSPSPFDSEIMAWSDAGTICVGKPDGIFTRTPVPK